MERGVIITLLVVAIVLVLGILFYVLISQNYFITGNVANSQAGQNAVYSNSANSKNEAQNSGITTVIVDSRRNNYPNGNYIGGNYGNMVNYHSGAYGEYYMMNGYRCYDYYDWYGRSRTHCMIVDYSYRHHHWDD